MKIGTLNSVRALTAAVLLAVLVFVLLVQYAPDGMAFSPNNYGWNGMRDVTSAYKVNFTTTTSGLPTSGVLAILQPSVGFSATDSASVRNFLNKGGTVLVADKSGVANTLLSGVGSAISIEDKYAISDPVFNWKDRSVPTGLVLPDARSSHSYLANVSGIALNRPSPLVIAGGQAAVVAVTSQFSVIQAEGSAASSSVASKGPFVVMASQKIGAGTLVVVGDSQFLLNSEWTVADNKILIGNLFANGNVFVDASHWTASPLTSSTAQVKAGLGQVYDSISGIPARYAFVLVVVIVALALVPSAETGRTRFPLPGWLRLPFRRARASSRPINGRPEGS